MTQAGQAPTQLSEILLKGIEAAPDGVMLVDRGGVVRFLNPAASRMTGWSSSEALGQNAQLVFNIINALTREASWNLLDQALKDQKSYCLLPNSVLIAKDGTELPIEDTISPFRCESGGFDGALVQFKDVSLSRWQLVKALHRAHHDPLTALPNRAALHEQILAHLARLGSESQSLCLLIIDVDRFKRVNDTFGHAVGDLVLQALATRIASCLRQTDLVCRVGGDEFVVLSPIFADSSALMALIHQLLDAGRAPIEILGGATSISFSIGIAMRQDPTSDVAGFLADADAAAYRAKSDGGDRAQLFEAHFRTDLSADRVLKKELIEALRADQFYLEYQPVISCRTGRMIGAEALVRWKHPDGRLLTPVSFLAAAERSGLMVQLGRNVLEKALGQRKSWLSSGTPAPHLFVNVSAAELMSRDYLEDLRELLISGEYEPDSITLELTESTLLGVEQQAIVIPAIRALRLKVAMDDFGIGYSNVGYLRNFSVDCVKIDRSFVSGIPQRSQDKILVRAIVAMAASVQATCIAEGVETAEQASFLREVGCTLAQGLYYSPPVSPDVLLDLLHQHWPATI